jgi:RNA polymerase-interacting CarD/CdnL/TRCF family regulator
MSGGLPSFGTGFTETETLIDVIDTYSNWDGESDPDFSTVRQRLREKFTTGELIAFGSVVEALGKFIESERMRRIEEQQASAEAPPAAG